MSKEDKKEDKESSLKDRLLKNSTLKDAFVLSESRLFEAKDIVVMDCPALNVALYGDALEGGLVPGIVQIAAESQHFKSKFAIEIVRCFLNKYPNGIVLFYDSEYGTPEGYFQGVNVDNIIHCPVVNLEEFKHDIVKQLKEITRDDKVLILVDSLGNMPTIKELDDAEKGKDTQDMTRAKVMKSVFRMIMPMINQKDVYAIMVNHTYKTIEMYAKDIPTGGCLLAGTKIITENGLKNIEEIKINDRVKTLNGYKRVTDVWNQKNLIEPQPECYEIEFENGYIVKCSYNHKFLVNNEWKKISELSLEDEVKNILE